MNRDNRSSFSLLGLALLGLTAGSGCTGPADEAAAPSVADSPAPASAPQTEASAPATVPANLAQVAFIKPSNTGDGDNFGAGGTLAGDAVALSKDGSTLAVGAPFESSGASGIDGDQSDESVYGAGAVYVYTRDGEDWAQQAYVKASNPGLTDNFGYMTVLSADGNTLAVSAHFESGSDTGVDADQEDDSIPQAGAVYVFTRTAGNWTQQAYIKATNTGELGQGEDFGDGDQFGHSMALSDDGDTLVVSAITEDSASPGIDGDQSDNSARSAGAVYLYRRTGTTWQHDAYIKASNPGDGDLFGYSIAITADGGKLAVGSFDEDGSQAGTNEQQDDEVRGSGAVYLFDYDGGTWHQTAYLKASNSEGGDSLGVTVAISDDGNTLAAAALDEDGTSTGVGNYPEPDQDTDASTGAVYIFANRGGTWSEQAYLKASNTGANDLFGSRLALSGDGNTLAAAAQLEDSATQGIDGAQDDDTAEEAGAVYVFSRTGDAWSQQAYVKGSNTEAFDEFGSSMSLSRDGSLLAIGAQFEDSTATGLGGDQSDNTGFDTGAVYLFGN